MPDRHTVELTSILATKWLLESEVQIEKVPSLGLEPRPKITKGSSLTTTPEELDITFLAVGGLDEELDFAITNSNITKE